MSRLLPDGIHSAIASYASNELRDGFWTRLVDDSLYSGEAHREEMRQGRAQLRKLARMIDGLNPGARHLLHRDCFNALHDLRDAIDKNAKGQPGRPRDEIIEYLAWDVYDILCEHGEPVTASPGGGYVAALMFAFDISELVTGLNNIEKSAIYHAGIVCRTVASGRRYDGLRPYSLKYR